jgi:hypothetical protein
MTLEVDRGAIGRTARRLQRGLHALLMSRLWCLRGLKPSGAPPLPLLAPISVRHPRVSTISWVPRSTEPHPGRPATLTHSHCKPVAVMPIVSCNAALLALLFVGLSPRTEALGQTRGPGL